MYLTSRSTFAFDTVVYQRFSPTVGFVAYRAKDAVSDYFTDRWRRPNVSVSTQTFVFIHSDNTVTIALDSSGGVCTKRGYRVGKTMLRLMRSRGRESCYALGGKGDRAS